MGKERDDKTNVIRLLLTAGVETEEHSYDPSVTDGESVAKLIGTDPDATCKTLVTTKDGKKCFVFVLPVNMELDLKACAALVGEKSLSMLPQKELFHLTGYIHGGCSPLGMKKRFPTFFENCVAELPSVTLSAGKVGRQVTAPTKEIMRLCDAEAGSFARPKTAH